MCKSMNTFLSVRANRGAEPCAFILREADEYLRALKAENDTLHQVVCKQLSQCSSYWVLHTQSVLSDIFALVWYESPGLFCKSSSVSSFVL